MFEKRVNPKDLEELKKREELINQHRLIINALEVLNQIYLRNILSKYGLDMNKNYSVDLKTGKIKEVKEPLKQQ